MPVDTLLTMTADPATTVAVDDMVPKWLLIIQGINEQSSAIMNWTLSIFGGSILLITSTSYNRPTTIRYRLFYLLFIPAWIFSFLSLKAANFVGRIAASALPMENANLLKDMSDLVNKNYASQLLYFQLTLASLSIWMALYLFWWIFLKPNDVTENS